MLAELLARTQFVLEFGGGRRVCVVLCFRGPTVYWQMLILCFVCVCCVQIPFILSRIPIAVADRLVSLCC